MQSPPFPRYLVPPRSKCSPQHHVLKHPQLLNAMAIKINGVLSCEADRYRV